MKSTPALLRAVLAAAIVFGVLASPSLAAQRGEGQRVLDDRERMLDSDTWIYGDLERGIQEARKTGKPLLIVFR
ncbi:MAG TPA: hypothetical protein PKE00_17300 [Planctomycetota bacterium]|nr:hypothetical protein [Planctomycetota bacterium]